MEKLGFNYNTKNKYSINFKRIKKTCVQNNNALNKQEDAKIYPIYLQVPYNIQKKEYYKLGVQKLPTNEDLHIYQLINGQKIAIFKSDECPNIKTCVNVGALDEEDNKEGISHFIEHVIHNGNKKYNKNIDEYMQEIGGYSNAETLSDKTIYYISLNDNNFENIKSAIDMQANMLYNPTFNETDKEKAIIISEMQRAEANEAKVAYNQLSKNLLSVNKPDIKDIFTGNIKTVSSINQQDLIDYHSKYYIPSNMTTLIASSIEPDELIKFASKSFLKAAQNKKTTKIERKQFNNSRNISRFDYISKDNTEKIVLVSFLTSSSQNVVENIKINALMRLISKRTGFSYEKMDLYNNFAEANFRFDSYETYNENEIFEYLKEGFHQLITNPTDEYELERIKNNMINDLETQYENIDNKTHTLIKKLSNNIQDFNCEKQIIQNLKYSDLIDALKYFDFKKCAIGVIHPKNTTQNEINNNFIEFQNYATPIVIPKTNKQTDISQKIKTYNINPYSSKPVYSATLDDNTNFVAINSKTDKCSILWDLYMPNTNSYNIAAKYVLNRMLNFKNIKEKFNEEKNGSAIARLLNSENGFYFSATCSLNNLEETILALKKEFDIDFNIFDFKQAKMLALNDIKSLKENACAIQQADRYGAAYNLDEAELTEALNKLTLNDLRKYYNDIILNSVSTVSVVAPFDNNKNLINQVANNINIPNFKFKSNTFEGLKNAYTLKTKSIFYAKEQKTGQANFGEIYNFKISGNSLDNIKFKLLNNILNIRLYNSLREKQGLAYATGSQIQNIGNDCSLLINVSSSFNNSKDIKKIYEGLNKNIQDLINKPISEKELQEAKDKFKRSAYNFLNDSLDAQFEINECMKNPQGLQILEDNFKILNAITPKDIQIAAQYAFKEAPDYLLDADIDLINRNKEYFETLGEFKQK